MEDAETIASPTAANISITVNPKILLALLVELGYLTPKPETAPQPFANIEQSLTLFETIDEGVDNHHALSRVAATHLKIHLLHKYLLAPAKLELADRDYQKLVTTIDAYTQTDAYRTTSINALYFQIKFFSPHESKAAINADAELQQICMRIENNLIMEGIVQ